MADVRAHMIAGPLQNVSVKYRNGTYIGDRVFPILDGVTPRTMITKYNKGAWFRDEAGIRAPGTRAKRGSYNVSHVNVNTKEYAFASDVLDEDRRDAKYSNTPPIVPDQDATELATDKVDLCKERRIAEIVKTSTWSGVSGGTDKAGAWAGDSNTFIADVETGIELIRMNSGFRPNKLLMTACVLPKLKQNADLLDRIKYTERGIVTAALIASMFDLQEVLIGDAVYSSANEKADGSDATLADIWDINSGKGMAFLYYTPPKPAKKTPSAGYQARISYGSGGIRRVTKWRENPEHKDVYEVAEETDIVQVCPDVGVLWKDVILT